MNAVIRSVKHKFLVFGTIVAILLIIYGCVNQTFLISNGNDIDSIVEFVRRDNSANIITYNNFISHNNIDVKNTTAYSEIVGDISNKFSVKEREIKITLIDDRYSSTYKKNMIAGSFPDLDDIEGGKRYIVISDSLSNKLFKSIDTIGNELHIFGEKYIVIGIYANNNSLLWRMFGDGFDRAFIPYLSIKGGIEKPIDVLAIKRKQEQSLYDIENLLKSQFQDNLSGYKLLNYTNTYNMLNRYDGLVIFLIGIFAIKYTLNFIIRYLIKFIKKIKEQDDYYCSSGNLGAKVKKITLGIFTIILCGLGIAYMISFMKFKFYMPDSYIPDDNIFDLNFYLEQFLLGIKEKNIVSNIKYSYLEYLYQNVISFNFFCSFLLIVFMIVTASFFQLIKLEEKKYSNILMYILIAMITGSIVGLILSFALGFEIYVPIKAFVVVIYFYVMSGLVREKSSFSNETNQLSLFSEYIFSKNHHK